MLEMVIIALLNRVNKCDDSGYSFSSLKWAMLASLGKNVDQEGRLLNARDISSTCGLPLQWLVDNQFLLDKPRAISFMHLIGFSTSPSLIEKQLLKQGRYEARFRKPLTKYRNMNLYTYAEILAIMERPLLTATIQRIITNNWSLVEKC